MAQGYKFILITGRTIDNIMVKRLNHDLIDFVESRNVMAQKDVSTLFLCSNWLPCAKHQLRSHLNCSTRRLSSQRSRCWGNDPRLCIPVMISHALARVIQLRLAFFTEIGSILFIMCTKAMCRGTRSVNMVTNQAILYEIRRGGLPKKGSRCLELYRKCRIERISPDFWP